MGVTVERHLEATGGCLVAGTVSHLFREEWFDPEFWGNDAVPVTSGGRGSAWFISSEAGDLVLRHFCRGGLPGRFIRRGYIYTGVDSTRSFAEFLLLHKLSGDGLPVPEPVAAGFRRQGILFYRASLIVRRIPGASPLSEFSASADLDIWRDAGACVRRFHDAGVFHADLNCMNILVADQIHLIDFDRGRVMPSGSDDRWKAANISRLERSVNKSFGNMEPALRASLWQGFLEGYGQEEYSQGGNRAD